MATHPDAHIAQLSAEQHGVLGFRQALLLGLSPDQLHRRHQTGRLEHLERGVYRIGGVPGSWRQKLVTATVAAGPESAVSHRAAGALYSFPACPPIVEVTTVRSRRYRGSNVTVHTTLRWARIDVSSWQGIRVTTPARTLIDLGAVLRPERVEEAVDFALREGLVSLPMLRWRHSELRGRGCRGAGVIAPILEARTVGRVPESRYEREFIRLARDLGLPDPELQYEIRSGGRVIARVDFAWPDLRIVVEIDGHLGHSTRQQRAHDATRENQIKLEGWQVFRFTTDQVFRRDPEMVRVLLAAFVPPLLVTLDRA